ncbi:MAG: Hsp20/alpha crystallin family protein, partial [Allosphingosinicella sp.]
MARNDELLERAPARHQLQNFAESAIEPVMRLRSEVDRLFGKLSGQWPSMRSLMPAGLLVPAVEMTETKKAYKLSVEVPGMDAADIEMHVHDGAIFIAG